MCILFLSLTSVECWTASLYFLGLLDLLEKGGKKCRLSSSGWIFCAYNQRHSLRAGGWLDGIWWQKQRFAMLAERLSRKWVGCSMMLVLPLVAWTSAPHESINLPFWHPGIYFGFQIKYTHTKVSACLWELSQQGLQDDRVWLSSSLKSLFSFSLKVLWLYGIIQHWEIKLSFRIFSRWILCHY